MSLVYRRNYLVKLFAILLKWDRVIRWHYVSIKSFVIVTRVLMVRVYVITFVVEVVVKV